MTHSWMRFNYLRAVEQNHYEETNQFWPLSLLQILALIWLTLKNEKTASNMEPPNGFEPSVGNPTPKFKHYSLNNNTSIYNHYTSFSSTYFCLQKFNLFTACLVNFLHEVLPWLAPREKFLKLRSPNCWKIHFGRSSWLQTHSLHIACRQQFFLGLQFRKKFYEINLFLLKCSYFPFQEIR